MLPRPGRLQGRQRHPRPRRGRPAPAHRRAPPRRRAPPGRATPSPGWAADEFVVLVEQCTGVEQLAEVADRALAVVRRPVHVRGREVVVSASIGIVARPFRDAAGTATGEDRRRCRGRRRAHAGRGHHHVLGQARRPDRIAVFDPARHANDVHLFELAGRMPGALERGEFHLEYQPLVALDDGAPSSGWRRWPAGAPPTASGGGRPTCSSRWPADRPYRPAGGLHLLEQACTDARSWVDSGADAGLVLSVKGGGPAAAQARRRPPHRRRAWSGRRVARLVACSWS
ncbi:diguanylate cyclase domain-containing protein [Pseudonocardia sp. ICBG1142]|uniref:diguanylate cyclase domain-containing protein n=1 Tax=Pseudonocardia sp. ICBG1142 TaxID=2846760 RepID=UPI0035A8E143